VVGRFGLDETPVLAAVWMLRRREESEERLFHLFSWEGDRYLWITV
jgi:hypothetical protein